MSVSSPYQRWGVHHAQWVRWYFIVYWEFEQMVELRPAYAWDCPECDEENFARAIVPEFSEEELAELREEYGVEAWEEGDFLMMPKKVACTNCKMSFSTVHFKDA